MGDDKQLILWDTRKPPRNGEQQQQQHVSCCAVLPSALCLMQGLHGLLCLSAASGCQDLQLLISPVLFGLREWGRAMPQHSCNTWPSCNPFV